MLNPLWVEQMPNDMVDIWSEAEEDILKDVARIISKYDYDTPAAMHSIQLLEATDATRKTIQKELSQLTGKSQKEISKLMTTAGNAVVKGDSAYYKAADVYKATSVNTSALNRVLNTGTQATLAQMRNIIKGSVKVGSSRVYHAIDRAQVLVSSGAFSKEQAIRSAVKELSDSGIGTTMTYTRNGVVTQNISIEAAVRRAVQTGVNQTAVQISDELATQLGCDLVEVSAHPAARPTHAAWQGKIYSRSGNSDKYPKLSTATGYGTITGLAGINCKHSFGPYVEGSPRTYTDEYLKELEEKQVVYNGKKMSEYDATQLQRYQERQIRKWKREAAMCEAAGDEKGADAARAKMKEWSAKQNNLTKQTGLRRKYEREEIYVQNSLTSGKTPNTINSVPKVGTKIETKTKVDVRPTTTKLKATMPDDDYEAFMQLVENADEDVARLYTHADELRKIERVKGGGEYCGRAIEYDFADRSYVNDGMSRYHTLAHEYGHYVDTRRYSGITFTEREGLYRAIDDYGLIVASSSDQFLAAMRADAVTVSRSITDIRRACLANNSTTIGVQDAIDGLGLGRVRWGHGNRYYNRYYNSHVKGGTYGDDMSAEAKDYFNSIGMDASNQDKVKKIVRNYETASELWANIAAAVVVGGDELATMKRYFPESVAEFMRIIKTGA